MSSPIDLVLSKLEAHKLKRTGSGAWIACCPHHEDRTPSLSIREGDDGRVLMHCHGGCSIEQVVGSMGLELLDLFPQDNKYSRGSKRTTTYRQALELIKGDALLVFVAAKNLAGGHQLTPEDLERLQGAAIRIQTAITEAGL